MGVSSESGSRGTCENLLGGVHHGRGSRWPAHYLCRRHVTRHNRPASSTGRRIAGFVCASEGTQALEGSGRLQVCQRAARRVLYADIAELGEVGGHCTPVRSEATAPSTSARCPSPRHASSPKWGKCRLCQYRRGPGRADRARVIGRAILGQTRQAPRNLAGVRRGHLGRLGRPAHDRRRARPTRRCVRLVATMIQAGGPAAGSPRRLCGSK